MSNRYVNAAKKLRVGRDPRTGRFKPNHIAKTVLLFLADGANEEGFFYFGDINYIAEILEMGASTVRKGIDFLDRYEFIEKKRIKKQNGYQMKFAPQTPKPKADDGNHDQPEDNAPAAELNGFTKRATTQLCAVMKVFTLPNIERWKKAFKWAFENEFSPEEFTECYRLRLEVPGRSHPVTPEQVINNLPFLNSLRLAARNGKAAESVPSGDYEDCDTETRREILQNLLNELAAGNEDYVRGSLCCFSENDRRWLLEKLNLENAA